jgi:peptidyl-prolyl cis-trans isomerase SurA
MIVTKDSLFFINQLIETCSSDHLLNYENSILEKKYPEFRYLMNEFHDGILLFEISDKKIWDRVTKDTIGLRHYYDDHKNNYLSRKGIEAKIYTLKSLKGEKSLLSAFKKYSKKPDTDKRLYEKFNKNNDSVLIIEDGKWYKGDDSQIDNIEWNTGLHSFQKDGFPSLIQISKVIEPVPLEFDEIRGEMMTSYQESLESEWIRQLKENYNVKINNMVLEEIKNRLKHE